MTKEEAKQWIPKLQAYVDGKVIEFRHSIHGWLPVDECEFIHEPSSYRIKPEPKPRPWRPEEVPVGALARTKGSDQRFIIHGVNVSSGERQVFIGLTTFSLDHCFHHEEHSLDHGKTWLPCGVEE